MPIFFAALMIVVPAGTVTLLPLMIQVTSFAIVASLLR